MTNVIDEVVWIDIGRPYRNGVNDDGFFLDSQYLCHGPQGRITRKQLQQPVRMDDIIIMKIRPMKNPGRVLLVPEKTMGFGGIIPIE